MATVSGSRLNDLENRYREFRALKKSDPVQIEHFELSDNRGTSIMIGA